MSASKPKHGRTSSKPSRKHFWAFRAPVIVGILASIAVMLALAFAVNILNVPNPNMILISGLVICSALFGYSGGVPAALVMMCYTLAFFSTNNDFITFTDVNLQKVIITAIGVVITTVFVSQLRHTVTQSFKELDDLAQTLEEDNQLLEEASSVDTLTGVRNRFALRRDFPGYLDTKLHVMMIDLDGFKAINDKCGHSAGDHALVQLGELLTKLFEPEHVYRYGGDEFLVVSPNVSVADFQTKATMLQEGATGIVIEGTNIAIRFSAGYVRGIPETQTDLRLMIRQADLNLYASKNAGKNQVTGGTYSRAIAERASTYNHGITAREGGPNR